MAIPNDDMPPSIFSPAPSTSYEPYAKKDIKERHTHWDEYNSVEDEKIKLENSKSGEDFVRMDLHYQATLLEKDKLLHDKEKEIQNLDQDISILKLEMGTLECNNKGMLKVVNEYEKTISEVISDRERERVCDEIAKEMRNVLVALNIQKCYKNPTPWYHFIKSASSIFYVKIIKR